MDAFGGLGSGQQVAVDILTDAYRIRGMVQTRFARVTDILNQQNSTHITITQATISEHADPAATVSAPSATSHAVPSPVRVVVSGTLDP